MKYLTDDDLNGVVGGYFLPHPPRPPHPEIELYSDQALIPNGKGGYNLVTITGPSDAFDDAIIAGLGGIDIPKREGGQSIQFGVRIG